MSDPSSDLNPYAPTSTVAQEPLPALGDRAENDYVPSALSRTALRWAIVCGISAVPSFFFGAMATNGEILGMLVGILIFVVGYTALDYGTREFSFRSNRRIRTTLKVTYGTRIIISILFPVGAYLDLVCGLITVSLVGALTGVELGPGDTTRTGLTFFSTILATLIQGCVLNVVLAFYAVAVHGVQWFFGLFRR